MKSKIVSVFFVFLLLVGVAGCSLPTGNSSKEYRLPRDSFPEYIAPNSATHSSPEGINEWVMTNYDGTFSWEDSEGLSHVVQITLPSLQPIAKFATEYNSTIEEYANDLLNTIERAAENGDYLNIRTVNYEAFLCGDLLSILITEEYESGKYDYQVATFDLVEFKELSTPELAKRLLGLDYATFLLASNLVVNCDFVDRYYQEVYADSIGQMTDEQLEEIDAYESILNSISTDTFNLYYRDLFVDNNGKIMLVFQSVIMSEDWWYGLETVDKISEIDLQKMNWTDISPNKALNTLMTLEVSERRYYPEFYSYLLQEALENDPETFIQELASFSSDEAERIIDYIFYAAWDEQRNSIKNICEDIRLGGNLTKTMEAMLVAIMDRVS